MTNSWFRMYAEFANDPKVQMLSEAMQRRLIMLFCLRCSDVTVTASDEEIAFQLRISTAELEETKTLFISKGFVTKSWEIRNWDKRQFRSDSSAERTRAYREKRRDVTVTSRKQPSDVLDTEQIQNRTAKSNATRASRKTPIPENFSVSDKVRQWAKEKGFNRLDEHLESFVMKAQAAGYAYVDWDKALMNAIRENWAKLSNLPNSATGSARPVSSDWMRDDTALQRKGLEIGVQPRAGEDWPAFRSRVVERVNQMARMQ